MSLCQPHDAITHTYSRLSTFNSFNSDNLEIAVYGNYHQGELTIIKNKGILAICHTMKVIIYHRPLDFLNKWVFKCFLNLLSVVYCLISGGRLSQARGLDRPAQADDAVVRGIRSPLTRCS